MLKHLITVLTPYRIGLNSLEARTQNLGYHVRATKLDPLNRVLNQFGSAYAELGYRVRASKLGSKHGLKVLQTAL